MAIEEGKGDDEQNDSKTGREPIGGSARTSDIVAGAQRTLDSKMKGQKDEACACPVFDEFLQAFIVT